MKASYSKQFLRQYAKLPEKIRQQVEERLLLWQKNPLHPMLRNHALKGKFSVYRSINITSNNRALYIQKDDEVIFDKIGTHSQLYG